MTTLGAAGKPPYVWVMKTGIRTAIRRFIEQNIVADDPLPERSWLDQQDMPCVQTSARAAVAGLPVEPLPPLPRRHGQQRLRRRQRVHDAAPNGGDGI
jgi:hypothetical protein